MTAQTASIPWKIESWQKSIATHLLQQQHFSPLQADRTTRQLILALLWLYLCEQRGIDCKVSPLSLQQGDRTYKRFLELLHDLHTQLGLSNPFPLLTPFELDDSLLHELFRQTYHPKVSAKPIASTLLGQAYEHLLSWSIDPLHPGKKSAGIYYTPAAIVQFILQSTLPPLLASPPSHSSLLDPACGSGAFLLAAYQYLLDWHLQRYKVNPQKYTEPNHAGNVALQLNAEGQWQLTQAERERILLTHIHGVDIDPQAVTVTRLCLWLMLLEDLPAPFNRSLPSLDHNIQQGNALIGSDVRSLLPNEFNEAELCPFDWERAFPEVMQNGGFDLVFGNPPYIDSEGMAVHLPVWRLYCGQKYQTAQGNWDLFCVFIEKAIELCRSGGFTSLIVPNKLASAGYASFARQILSQENSLLSIRDYSRVPVFAASVYPLVYVAQKIPSEPTAVRCEIMQTLNRVQHSRSLPLHAANPGSPWLLMATPPQANLLIRLQTTFPPLGTIAQVTGAATVGEAYQLQALIQNIPEFSKSDLRLVNSGTIDRYCFLWGKKRLRYLGQTYLYPVIPTGHASSLPSKRYQQAKQPKLIVAGMTRRLECALDANGEILAGKSTSVIQVQDGAIDLRYLLGLLNSHLLSVYFNQWFAGNRLQGGYGRVGPPQLRQLPICIPDFAHPSEQSTYKQMIEWVDQLLQLKQYPSKLSQKTEYIQKIQVTEQAIDRLVYQLYQLTDEEINAL